MKEKGGGEDIKIQCEGMAKCIQKEEGEKKNS
jgi:hypothetical protein